MEKTSDSEYGLSGLSELPLLEQVHRIIHAIKMKYPYKETKAWKSLSIKQKKDMLRYIQESNKSVKVEKTLQKAAEYEEKIEQSHAPSKTADPYLLLREHQNKKSERDHKEGRGTNCEYAAPEIKRRRPTARDSQIHWAIVDGEHNKCACGEYHECSKTKDSEEKDPETLFLKELKAMLTAFGDAEFPCDNTAKKVGQLAGQYMKRSLESLLKNCSGELTFEEVADYFSIEAKAYLRWRSFKSKTEVKDDTLDEADLADELEEFSTVVEIDDYEMDAHFQERMLFADQRTADMSSAFYDRFAKVRRVNFMKKRGEFFTKWLGISKCTKPCLELLGFITYDFIGVIIERGIKARTGGKLVAQTGPLLTEDILRIEEALPKRTKSAAASPTASDATTAATPSKRAAEADPETTIGAKRLKRLR